MIATSETVGALAQSERSVTIRVRAKQVQRSLIDQAAKQAGQTRSAFMMQAACQLAEEVVLDQAHFALGATDFTTFLSMLDNPPPPTDQLRRTLSHPAPWKSRR